jgi:hypothetical protein
MARERVAKIADLSEWEMREFAAVFGGRISEVDFLWDGRKSFIGVASTGKSEPLQLSTHVYTEYGIALRDVFIKLAKHVGAYDDGWITEEVPDRQEISIWGASVETCKAIANVYGGEISIAEVNGTKAGLLRPPIKTYLPCWVRYDGSRAFHGCDTNSTWDDPTWAYKHALRGFLVSVEAEMKDSEWSVTLPEGVTVDV